MTDHFPDNAFTAVVLAGERGPADPLVNDTQSCCKAMIRIDGIPMVLRVLNTLGEASRVNERILSGPAHEHLSAEPAVCELIDSGQVAWRKPQETPSTSAFHAMQSIPDDARILVTTADHPLLSAEIVDRFCSESAASDADVTVGLAPYGLVRQAFPQMKKTILRFREGDYCGANLFTFLTPQGRRMADYWRRVESQRKNPLRVIKLLGWRAVIKYLLGLLTLHEALEMLSRRLDLRFQAVILPYAEAAVDVDSVSDHTLVQEKLSRRS